MTPGCAFRNSAKTSHRKPGQAGGKNADADLRPRRHARPPLAFFIGKIDLCKGGARVRSNNKVLPGDLSV